MSGGAQGRRLPAFPVDDFTLDQLEHAMATSVEVGEDGEYRCVGGEFTLSTFLKFMSGYDPERASHVGYVGDVPMYEVWDEQYSEHDVLRALVAEVRRLRAECESLRESLHNDDEAAR